MFDNDGKTTVILDDTDIESCVQILLFCVLAMFKENVAMIRMTVRVILVIIKLTNQIVTMVVTLWLLLHLCTTIVTILRNISQNIYLERQACNMFL